MKIFLIQGWICCMSPSEYWECQFAFVLETKILHRKSLKQINLCFPSTSKSLMPLRTFFCLMNFPSDFSRWEILTFPCMWWVFDSYEPGNDWSQEVLLNGRSVCSVMGEGYIRRKLGNSRIGGAITADIRALNHLTFLTFQLPSISLHALIAPRLPTSVSCVRDRVGLKDLNTVRTAAWAVDKPTLISQHLNTPLKLDTLTTPQ